MVEWARVVFTGPGVLEGVRMVNLVCLGEVEPKVSEGLSRDELELGESVWVGSGASEVGHQGTVRCLG
jgi:hypothetical protein